MRKFTQEQYQAINVGGYDLLPTYFAEATLGKELAQCVVQCVHNEVLVDNKTLDELLFLCYSNGAKIPPMTAIIPSQSFQYVENFKKTLSEFLEYTGDVNVAYKAFVVLYLNNMIRIYPEEAFVGNLALDRMAHYFLPEVTDTIHFIELIEDLIEHKKPAFIQIINYQDGKIEQITASKIKSIVGKEEQLAIELETSRQSTTQLKEENEKLLAENKELVKSNRTNNEKNRANIITIVSLIAAIIPFFIVNLSVLVNSFNIIMLLCINGTMCLIIGLVFFLVSTVNKDVAPTPKRTFVSFIIVGGVILAIGVSLWILAATVPAINEFISLLSIINQ